MSSSIKARLNFLNKLSFDSPFFLVTMTINYCLRLLSILGTEPIGSFPNILYAFYDFNEFFDRQRGRNEIGIVRRRIEKHVVGNVEEPSAFLISFQDFYIDGRQIVFLSG